MKKKNLLSKLIQKSPVLFFLASGALALLLFTALLKASCPYFEKEIKHKIKQLWSEHCDVDNSKETEWNKFLDEEILNQKNFNFRVTKKIFPSSNCPEEK